MTNFIKLDINEYLQTKYPNLDPEHIDLIATDVSRRWDYTHLIDDVDLKCKQTAYYANIKLSDESDNEDGQLTTFEPLEHSSECC